MTRMYGMMAMLQGMQDQGSGTPQLDMTGLHRWLQEMEELKGSACNLDDRTSMVEHHCGQLLVDAEAKFVNYGELTQTNQSLNGALERLESLDQDVQQTQADMQNTLARHN